MNPKLIWASLAIFLPAIPLFVPHGSFNNDWINNIWQIGYYGEYFRAQHHFPAAYHTSSYIGMSYPTFYAYLLYPLLSLFSLFLGPILALKVSAVLVLAIQYWVYFKLFSKLTLSVWKGGAMAALINWAIYPLTNLFHRAAIPEFFATHFLFIGVGGLAIVYFSECLREKSLFVNISVFMMLLTLGSHPITAMLGAPVFVLLGFFFREELKRYTLRILGLTFLCFLILSPWVYVTGRFLSQLSHLPKFLLQTEVFDAYWVRFFPLPLDLNQVTRGVDISTPFLDAQVNIPVLILVLSIFILNARKGIKIDLDVRRICLFSFGMAVFIATVSVDMQGGNPIAHFLKPILYFVQYSYRLTTYINLFLVIALMGLLHRNSLKNHSLFIIVICLGSMALVSKLQRSFAVIRYDGLDERVASNLTEMPTTVYGANDFIVSPNASEFEGPIESVKRIWFLVGKNQEFGKVYNKEFNMDKPGWVSFNLYPFPWNRIKLDGRMIETSEWVVMKYHHWVNERLLSKPNKENAQSEYHLGLFMQSGRHEVEYIFEPDSIWVKLRWISGLAGMGLILVVAFTNLGPLYHLINPKRSSVGMHA